MSDNINHPPHYTRGGIETIDFIEAKELSWCLGNVVKYVSRAGHKGDKLEDLEKAAWYLRREIERLGGGVNSDESQSIRQRDEQIAKLTQQINDANKAAATWSPAASRIQDERDQAIAERDEATRLADVNFRHFMEAVQQRDAARTQIAELTQQLNDANKAADRWNATACQMQDGRDAAVAECRDLKRFDEARGRHLLRALEQRDEARKQVVELTKQLVDTGLLQSTEAQ